MIKAEYDLHLLLLHKKFEKKNIIWLGDSIHAYTEPDGITVPEYFECHSGAKCYNWCQSGTTMALMDEEAYDPYSGVEMVNALISRDFIELDEFRVEQGFEAQIAEMKAFDMDEADYMILEFGTNDAIREIPPDNGVQKMDVYTTGGALRYILHILKEQYPALKIFVCNVQPGRGHIWGDSSREYDFQVVSEVIERVCDEYEVPMIDIYGELGLTSENEEDILSDGLHRSHEGKLRQVHAIEKKLLSTF